MHLNDFEIVDTGNLPARDAPDHLLIRWLEGSLGRQPIDLDVIALRAALRRRAQENLSFWQRLRQPPHAEADPVADFLASEEGALLVRMLGSLSAAMAALATPDPWLGIDGRHPYREPEPWRDQVRRRVAINGGKVPPSERLRSVKAYVDWKLGCRQTSAALVDDEALEFLAPEHAAALNASSLAAVIALRERLRDPTASDVVRFRVLDELSASGRDVLRKMREMAGCNEAPPAGIWPPETLGDTKSQPSTMPQATAPHA